MQHMYALTISMYLAHNFIITQPRLQTGCKQDSKTLAPERPGDPYLGVSGRPCHKGTSRSHKPDGMTQIPWHCLSGM